jgi:hypothetical protein
MPSLMPDRASSSLRSITLVLALTALAPFLSIAAEEDPEPNAETFNKARLSFLQVVNTASENALRKRGYLPAETLDRILAFRASGKKFEDLDHLQRVSGMTWNQIMAAIETFTALHSKAGKTASGNPGRSVQGTAAESTTQGAADPGATQLGGLVVRPGFYGKLPGYEHLHTVDPSVKVTFLEIVNRELCPCGCKNETLAFCLVNDPGCPIVKARVKKIYDDIARASAQQAASSEETTPEK